ncbi:unnamed protein product [Prunus armeniaca]|uniref:DUF7870 domain-containing protein n=1 Tax=Prunus armeniaca TaxID=36596 RepID=A0A6J5UZL2_PRUAR|nr:unnamed protein product [Prunus armeniaca]
MDPPTRKPNRLRNILVRILTFGVLVLAVRFAYVITLAGESCGYNDFYFFPDNLKLHGGGGEALRVRRSTQPRVPELWTTKKWRRTVDYYSAIFQGLIADGFLSPNFKTLCVETLAGEDVLALKENGFVDSIGVSKNASPPLVVAGEAHRQQFDEATFDFEFSALDRSGRPVDFSDELCRTLKPGGFFVAHIVAKDSYSFNSFIQLFNCCRLIRSSEIDGLETTSVLEVVMKKEAEFSGGNSGYKCSVPGYKREIVRKAEALIEQEPLKPWIALKRNLKKVKYLTSMVDISYKQRYVYVDVGARSYGSSIGSWFKKQYPKQNISFEVYAIEADKAFHEEYRTKKGVSLLPYAAWVRNETLFFEITRDPSTKTVEKGRGMGRVQPVRPSSNYGDNVDKIEGFDFADWLKNTVSERDFVVVKMDVEGTEFHLIPRLIETGAICLIDEIFLECHYNRWQRCCPGQRSPKFKKTYGQCLDLFNKLRDIGVLVHQWW